MIITVDDFKGYFNRDFPYTPDFDDIDGYITDNDIDKAIREAELGFNKDLFDKTEAKIPMLYLSAFYLVIDIKNGMAGISSTGYSSFVASKSVGNVSESYGIPSWATNNPMYSIYMDNGYGKKYLSYLLPRINGFFYLSKGATTWEV